MTATERQALTWLQHRLVWESTFDALRAAVVESTSGPISFRPPARPALPDDYRRAA